VPITVGDDCVGAVGVSGATSQQDEQIAAAGIAAIVTERTSLSHIAKCAEAKFRRSIDLSSRSSLMPSAGADG
jgi:hypothetical protein